LSALIANVFPHKHTQEVRRRFGNLSEEVLKGAINRLKMKGLIEVDARDKIDEAGQCVESEGRLGICTCV